MVAFLYRIHHFALIVCAKLPLLRLEFICKEALVRSAKVVALINCL